jgi:hypothetical protein
MRKFKVGLDIHGVINKDPQFFKFLSNLIVDSGNEVHIITGGSWNEELISELIGYGIVWTHYFSVYDHLIENRLETFGIVKFPDGTEQLKFSDEVWDRVKGDYCHKMGIDIHLDDTDSYNKFFKTPFSRYFHKK